MKKTHKKVEPEPTLPTVFLSWKEACAIDYDEIGFIPPPPDKEEEPSSTSTNGQKDDTSELVHIFSKPPPKIRDLSSIHSQIKKYIDTCISSGHDPLAKHGFYVKVEELLFSVQDKGLISSDKQEVDSLWIKYDQWAREAYDSLQEKNTSQFESLANDIFKFAPQPPGRTPYNRRKCTHKFFRNTKWKRTGSTKNLQPTINRKIHMTNRLLFEFLQKAHDSQINIRDNLAIRREFFDNFPHFIDKAHEPFMDFYWNALFHRNLSYYERAGEKRHQMDEIRKRQKEKALQKSVPQPVGRRGRPPKNVKHLNPIDNEIPVMSHNEEEGDDQEDEEDVTEEEEEETVVKTEVEEDSAGMEVEDVEIKEEVESD